MAIRFHVQRLPRPIAIVDPGRVHLAQLTPELFNMRVRFNCRYASDDFVELLRL
jgi:hypothetical protein